MVEQVQTLFEQSRYNEVIAACVARPPTTLEEQAWYAISLLRTGRFKQAAPLLEQVYRQGHLEAGVELGNAWRGLGDYKGAIKLLTDLAPRLSDDLAHRALRWRGVAEFQLSHGVDGFDKVQQAYQYYLNAGNLKYATRTAHTLTEMYRVAGRLGLALQTIETHGELMATRPPFHLGHFDKLRLVHLSISLSLNRGHFVKALPALRSAGLELRDDEDSSLESFLVSGELDTLFYTQDIDKYYRFLLKHEESFQTEEDIEVTWWTSLSLAEHHSRTGEYSRATALLNVDSEVKSSHASEWLTINGLVQYRKGEYESALVNFEAARQDRNNLIHQILDLRCLLFETDTRRRLSLPWRDQADHTLQAMLASELGLIHFKTDFQELSGLVIALFEDAALAPILQHIWTVAARTPEDDVAPRLAPSMAHYNSAAG